MNFYGLWMGKFKWMPDKFTKKTLLQHFLKFNILIVCEKGLIDQF